MAAKHTRIAAAHTNTQRTMMKAKPKDMKMIIKPKAAAKKPAAKKVAAKTVAKPATKIVMKYTPAEEFRMPIEVKDWIDQAMSRLKSLQSKIDRLSIENAELKSYKKWAENRILGTSYE